MIQAILKALDEVTADVDQNSSDPVVFKSTGLSIGTCTNSAFMLQEKLTGDVVGYVHDDNDTASLGECEGGHDFLVLPEYIVDWWAMDTYEKKAVLHRVRDAKEIAASYGDPAYWMIWSEKFGTFIPYKEKH